MWRWARRLGLGLIVIVLAGAAVAAWKREELSRLMAVQTLFDPDRIVWNFSHMDQLFLSTPLTDAPDAPLPRAVSETLPDDAARIIEDRRITALMVLRNGAVTYESYHLDTGAEDLRISWSVAKSFLSLLAGQIVATGALALDDEVVLHAPQLAGSAYDGATVEDVLQMESGVAFNEDYADPGSDINRMGRVVALGGTLDGFTTDLTARDRMPGKAWQYVSMDTHVLGMVLRGATGRAIPDLITPKLLEPMGIGPAYLLTDGEGVGFVLGGLNMRTEDYARLGLLVAQGGALGGRQVVPADWIDRSTRASANTEDGKLRYGYQWWMPADAREGEVMALGVYGQFVYVDRARDVVVVVNAADPAFRDRAVRNGMIDFFRRIAAAGGPA